MYISSAWLCVIHSTHHSTNGGCVTKAGHRCWRYANWTWPCAHEVLIRNQAITTECNNCDGRTQEGELTQAGE